MSGAMGGLSRMTSWSCSGWSMTEYHSARAAARRLPLSDSGRCSKLSRAITSSRAALSRSSSAAAWEKFAIDHALGEAVDPAEAHAFGQFSQSIGDKALVARAERAKLGCRSAARHGMDGRPQPQDRLSLVGWKSRADADVGKGADCFATRRAFQQEHTRDGRFDEANPA